MKFESTRMLAAAGLLLAALLGEACAQVNLPFGPSNHESDLQLFAPLELDLDNQPPDDGYAGYFFEYNKLFWSYSGERVTVGSPNVTEFAEIIYYDPFPNDESDPPPPHQIENTLRDVPPDAGFAMGNRYELGYRERDNGWLISVLDGPELHQSAFYGFPRAVFPPGGLPPFIDPDYTAGDDITPGPVQEIRAFGWGSVPVLFETPIGYKFGFRDYLSNLFGASIGTQWGPMWNVGNYGAPFGELDDIDDFLTLADDLDGDGNPGAIGVVNDEGEIVGFIIADFDDLHEFNVFFNSVTIRNTTETNGVELMWSHRLTNRHWQAKHQNNYLQMYYGARYMKLYDEFTFFGEGSFLGDTTAITSFDNSIVGPQIGLRWVNQRQRWRLQADGRFMFGYNQADWAQIGLTGEDLIPGALNKPLYARPTAFSNDRREREFSPIAELRLQASYNITKSAALKLGYTGMFVGAIHRAAPSVRYSLPDFGYADPGTQDLWINGFDLGAEFCY